MMDGIVFRHATRAELDLVLGWAAAEGWNPGLEDADPFWATDPQGFFVAVSHDMPVAAISVVNHGTDIAFLGLYLCLPAYRGTGIGFGLWQHAIAHAGARTIGLDGVPDQQANYRKSGFELIGQTFRFSGTLEGAASSDVRPVMPADYSALIHLDSAATGYAKPVFLTAWLADTKTRQSLVLGAEPRGFATIRACRSGHKIGPVVAQTLQDAVALIRGVVEIAGARDVMIDVPDTCAPLLQFCRDQGLSVSFNTARMYRGLAPKSGAYHGSIATMELG